MSTRTPILQIEGLSFSYPGQPALFSNWSASIPAGVTLIHGDTGSGKSTLLRLIAARSDAFWCDPTTDAFDQLTARDCTSSLCADDAAFDRSTWQALIDGFNLAPHLDKPMYMLSTGSKRKVWLAAALASNRALTLLDEPTGGLDTASINCLMRALADLAGHAQRAIVVASAERLERVPLAAVIELPPR